MSRADRLLRFVVATTAASPWLLAGCAAFGIDRPKEPIARLPNRPTLVRLAIAQLQYGNAARFQIVNVTFGVKDFRHKRTYSPLQERLLRSARNDILVIFPVCPRVLPMP